MFGGDRKLVFLEFDYFLNIGVYELRDFMKSVFLRQSKS